ncbi:DUF3332 domain-containing protein [Bacteroidota bacterium]
MKKITAIILSVTLLFGTLSYSGCIGSFGLTKKVYDFNMNVGDKWVNELVFLAFVIIPVYEVSAIVDIIILNLIEFWSGDNPVSYIGEDGKHYVKSGDDVYEMTENKRQLVFNKVVPNDEDSYQIIIDKKSRSAFINRNGEITKIAESNKDNSDPDSYIVYRPDGQIMTVAGGPNMRYSLFEAWGATGGYALAE